MGITDMVGLQTIDLLVGIGWVVLITIACYSLASGLYQLTNFIEDHPALMKKWIKREITVLNRILFRLTNYFILMEKASLIFHVGFFIFDGLPWILLILSAATQILYLLLLPSFPLISFSSLLVILSIAAAFLNHILWFGHFFQAPHEMSQIVAFYLLIIWFTPFCFLISMSNNAASLPNFNLNQQSKESLAKNRNFIGSLLSSVFSRSQNDNPNHTN